MFEIISGVVLCAVSGFLFPVSEDKREQLKFYLGLGIFAAGTLVLTRAFGVVVGCTS